MKDFYDPMIYLPRGSIERKTQRKSYNPKTKSGVRTQRFFLDQKDYYQKKKNSQNLYFNSISTENNKQNNFSESKLSNLVSERFGVVMHMDFDK